MSGIFRINPEMSRCVTQKHSYKILNRMIFMFVLVCYVMYVCESESIILIWIHLIYYCICSKKVLKIRTSHHKNRNLFESTLICTRSFVVCLGSV